MHRIKDRMSQSIPSQIASVLLDEEVISNAEEQIQSGEDRIPVRKKDIDFRLLNTGQGTSNLEFTARNEAVRFFQPVGFFSGDGNITVLKEFQDPVDDLISDGFLPDRLTVRRLNLEENALIGAFSAHAVVEAMDVFKEIDEKGFERKYDEEFDVSIPAHIRFSREIMSNGLDMHLYMTMSGYPQAKLDEKYDMEKSIGVYRRANQGVKLIPTDEFRDMFERFKKLKLLTSFKIL